MTTQYYDLSTYHDIIVSGPDAATFLQGQLTCDMTKLEPQQAVLAAHCNVKGRMVSLFWVYLDQDSYHLVMPACVIETALKHLQKFAMFSKVTLTQDTQGYWGVSSDLPENAIVLTTSRGLIPQLQFKPDTAVLPQSAWESLDIQAGIAMLTPETVREFIPNEVNLLEHGGVSLTKGCYIGQEIIARLHYLGKSKKQLLTINIQGNQPIPGELLIDEQGKSLGQLYGYAPNETHYLGLALVQGDLPTVVHLQQSGGQVTMSA